MKRLVVSVIASVLLTSSGHAAEALTKPLPAAAPETLGFASDRLAKLDSAMKALVDAGYLPGVSTMLIRHGKIAQVRTFGKVDLASGALVKRDTIFRIYSQTKPVTAVAMAILFEEGRWNLNDPVTKFIPEFANLKVLKSVNPDGTFVTEDAVRPPTMRELMTHTAGFGYGLITDRPLEQAYRDKVLPSKTRQDFINAIASLPLHDQPGTKWRYSIAVDLQGYIIEKLSGQSLPDFMRDRIFNPLGMTDTAFNVPNEKSTRLATLYIMDSETKRPKPADGFMVLDLSKVPIVASGGGGLVSTLDDYARFAQMLANGGSLDGVRILAPGTVKLLRSDILPEAVAKRPDSPFGDARGVGFGFDGSVLNNSAKADTLEGIGTYSWGGAAGTWFWIDPTNDVVFLGMMHVLAKGVNPALADIDGLSQNLVYGALVDPAK